MNKILLILACALGIGATAQNTVTTTADTGGATIGLDNSGKKLDFCDTGGIKLPPDGKKHDVAVSGDPITKGGSDKKLDASGHTGDTGGTIPVSGGKKKDDYALDTGGTLPGGAGKKHDFAAVDTGDTGGIRIPPDGKKHDLMQESGGSGATGTIKDGTGGTKKLDLADTGGSGAVIIGGGKKLDRMADTGGSSLGSGSGGMGKKLDAA